MNRADSVRPWLASILGILVGVLPSVQRCPGADPAEEQASFKVLDGFEVNLFASEREGAIKPIAIRFDADGRLWMVGSTQYPQIRPGETPDDKITILEDTNGDGRADRSTVFAGGLLLPLGLELGDGGAYVASATELVHLRDTDGDGRADERRVVFRGFGTGDAHQTINSFAWGPSGELMISQGLHANSRVETPWGLAELRQAGLFRLWPRRLKLDAIWTGAMGAHNPFGTAFDRWGQPFVFAGNGHGIFHLTPALIETDHFLLHPALWQQGRKFGGADFVENSHWPPSSQGEVISGGYLQNTVERFRITDANSTFKVDRLPPLIESTNTAFRIVDARFGPNGALYLCDWYNHLIGHYQTSLRHPDRDHVSGRIWRVTAKGRPLAPWKRLSRQSVPELLDALRSPERWTRQLAKRTLADRPTAEVLPALNRWLNSEPLPDVHAQFEALGVFAAHETIETNLLARLAQSSHPSARAYAARVVGHWAARLPQPLAWLAPLITDPDPRVRLEAVVACSYVQDPRAVELATRATDLPMDSHLDYAYTQAVHALKPLWRELERRGELRFEGHPSRAAAFARADGSGDTVAESAARLTRIGEVALDRDSIERLAAIVARSGGPKELAILLRTRSFMLGSDHLAAVQAETLNALWLRLTDHPVLPSGDVAAQLQPLLQHNHLPLRYAAIRLAGAWHVDPARDAIATLAADSRAESDARRAAIAALGGFAKQDDRSLLLDLAMNASPEDLRGDALRALTLLDPAAAAPAAVRWLSSPVATPEVAGPGAPFDAVITTFLSRRDGASALATAIRQRTLNPNAARHALALLAASGRRDPDLTTALESAAGIVARPPVGLDDIPTLAASVRARGNPTAGKAIFERPHLACVNCHALDGVPGKVGPDLGALGTAQPIEYILGAIIAPQKEVKEGFVAHEIETRDGEIHQGYLRGETDGETALLDHLVHRVVRVPSSQIASRRQLGSLMPDGLADALSRDELRDLVAFLARLGRRD